jgi:hypothetical protein
MPALNHIGAAPLACAERPLDGLVPTTRQPVGGNSDIHAVLSSLSKADFRQMRCELEAAGVKNHDAWDAIQDGVIVVCRKIKEGRFDTDTTRSPAAFISASAPYAAKKAAEIRSRTISLEAMTTRFDGTDVGDDYAERSYAFVDHDAETPYRLIEALQSTARTELVAAFKDALVDGPQRPPIHPRLARWSREAIITAFQEWVAYHGRIPSASERAKKRDMSLPGVQTVVDHFGSWNAGLQEAGFAVRPQKRWRTEDMVHAVCRKVKRGGRWPTARELQQDSDTPAPQTLCDRLGAREIRHAIELAVARCETTCPMKS